MFQSLKENRSLIMGLAIFYVAFYHIPWIDRAPWIDFLHDIGYLGVDVFLFLSGMGLCHSVKKRGREGYLRQRCKRIFPGLMPFLLLWSLVMLGLRVLSFKEFFGSVTLLGWWFGQKKQLNWYFSAVWFFYFLGALLYRPVVEGKKPLLWVVFVSWLSFIAQWLSPYHYHAEAFTRVPVFLAGMLLGRMELRGETGGKWLRVVLYGAIPVGLFLTYMTWSSWGETWGTYLGLWWYPFLLVVPGGVFVTGELAGFLRRSKVITACMKPVEWLGDASAEALMLHVGIYKLIQLYWSFLPKYWMLILLGCCVLSVEYRKLVQHPKPSH